MNELIKPKIKDYFSISDVFAGGEAFVHYETQNFNKTTALFLLIAGLFLVSFFKFKLIAFPLTLLTYILVQYLYTYILARSITIRRISPIKAKENDSIIVEYIISNKSRLSLKKYTLKESFEGTSSSKTSFMLEKIIRAGSRKKIKLKMQLNEGFGEKHFHELILVIEDSLGLFKFKILYKKDEMVLVYPEIQNIIPTSISNNDETYLSGDFEIHKKGISPNFYGIRHYHFGDPMKFINWKISGKLNELVVNEYENSVNLKVNYVLNFDEKTHMGKGVNSTWEYSRDLCLALAKKDIEKNHHVEVFSNDFHIEQGSGKKHFELMELKMCYLNPKDDDGDVLLLKLSQRMEKGSALVFISPLNGGRGLKGNIDFIKKHGDYFSEIHLYLIDGFNCLKKQINQDYVEELLKQRINANHFLKEDIAPLLNLNVKVFKIEIEAPHRIKDLVQPVRGGDFV